MLHNDNIISTGVSEAIEKIPKMRKIITNAPLCVLLCTATTVTKSRPTYSQLTVEIVAYLLTRMTRKFAWATQFSNVVYLQTARRYFYQDGFTRN